MMWAVLFVGISQPYDKSVDPVVRFGWRDMDCIEVRIEPEPRSRFPGCTIDVWCCGGRLYGPFHEFPSAGIDGPGVHLKMKAAAGVAVGKEGGGE
jgi:hypothetical protein